MVTVSDATSSRQPCAICKEDILPAHNVSILNCKHVYHGNCLQPWLNASDTCPLDRAKITSINGIAIEPAGLEESDAPAPVEVPGYLVFVGRGLPPRGGRPSPLRALMDRTLPLRGLGGRTLSAARELLSPRSLILGRSLN